jgi:ERCC4-type nuclease
MKLYVDSREPYHIKEKFKSMALDYDDLEVEIKALETGDFLCDYFVVERKDLDDFISSFTTVKKTKSKQYLRLREQTKRLIEMPQKVKILLIVGENFEEAYSRVNEHAFNAQVAKLSAQGINVVERYSGNDWPDYIYRLWRMCRKYSIAKDQSSLEGVLWVV